MRPTRNRKIPKRLEDAAPSSRHARSPRSPGNLHSQAVSKGKVEKRQTRSRADLEKDKRAVEKVVQHSESVNLRKRTASSSRVSSPERASSSSAKKSASAKKVSSETKSPNKTTPQKGRTKQGDAKNQSPETISAQIVISKSLPSKTAPSLAKGGPKSVPTKTLPPKVVKLETFSPKVTESKGVVSKTRTPEKAYPKIVIPKDVGSPKDIPSGNNLQESVSRSSTACVPPKDVTAPESISAGIDSPQTVTSLTEACVCCRRVVLSEMYNVDSAQGRTMDLKNLISRFGGIDIACGSVCKDCVLTLQAFENQCKKFFKVCHRTQDEETTALKGTDEQNGSVLSERTRTHSPLSEKTLGLSQSTVIVETREQNESATSEAAQGQSRPLATETTDQSEGEASEGLSQNNKDCGPGQSASSGFSSMETQCDFSDGEDGDDDDDGGTGCDMQIDPPEEDSVADENNVTQNTPGNEQSTVIPSSTGTKDSPQNATRRKVKTVKVFPARNTLSFQKLVSIIPRKGTKQDKSDKTAGILSPFSQKAAFSKLLGTPSKQPEKSGTSDSSADAEMVSSEQSEKSSADAGLLQFPANFILKCTRCSLTFASVDLLKTHVKDIHGLELSQGTTLSIANSSPSKWISILGKSGKLSPARASTFAVGSKKFIFLKVYKKREDKSGSSYIETGEKANSKLFKAQFVNQTAGHGDHTYDKDNWVDTGSPEGSEDGPFVTKMFSRELPAVVCGLCNMAYFSTMQLSAHYTEKHGGLYEDLTDQHIEVSNSVQKYKCKLCGYQVKNRVDVSEHIRVTHSIPSPYKCTICQKSFTNRRQVKNHLPTHFPKTKGFCCWKCKEDFASRSALEGHFCWEQKIKSKREPREEPKAGDAMDSETEGDCQYPCPLCEKPLPSKKQLKIHWKEAHNTFSNKREDGAQGKTEALSDVVNLPAEESTSVMDDSVLGDEDDSQAASNLSGDISLSALNAPLPFTAEKIRMYLCSLCNTSFRTTQTLSVHWQEKHNSLFVNLMAENVEEQPGLDKYKCKLCSRCFTSEKSISAHMRTEHSMTKPFKCVLCSKALTSKKKMRTHLRAHFPSSLFRCSECSNEFKTQDEILKHSCWVNYVQKRLEEENMKVKTVTVTDENGTVNVVNAERAKKPFCCSLCRQTFRSTRILSKHWEETHDVYIEKLKTEKPETHVELPKKTEAYQCQRCGEQFAKRRLFERHRSKHTLPKCYKCTICHQTFDRMEKARLHLRFHLSTRPDICHICGKSFMARKHLRNHIRTVHGAPEDKMKYVCEECGKGFCFSHSLKRHREAMHMAEADKPLNHKCTICGKGFFVRSRLLYHMSSHLDHAAHVCNVCGKAFKCRLSLRAHQKGHSAVNRYGCSMCQKRFSHKLIRTAHRLVEHHKGCPTCGLALFTKKDAVMHKRVCNGFAKIQAEEEAAESVSAQLNTMDEAVPAVAAINIECDTSTGQTSADFSDTTTVTTQVV